MKLILIYFILITILICKVLSSEIELTNETYGKTWMYFPNGDEIPEIIYLTTPPETRSPPNIETDIVYELYTQSNSRQPREFEYSESNPNVIWDSISKYFDPKLETKFIVHGWKSSSTSDTVQNIKNEYLKRQPYNIFAVNWNKRASSIYYFGPAKDTRNIGQSIAKVLDYLIEEKGAEPKRIHLIGHSLGAHTVGYAGSLMEKGPVYRITGLDPASPGFDNAPVNNRLDIKDAEFVDVIHTCAGILGYQAPLGHVDFYPNSGQSAQPGCEGVSNMLQACSHGRSHRFFAESINTETGFYAYPCNNWEIFISRKCSVNTPILMGDKVPLNAKGIYYLHTKSSFPFASGQLE